MKILFITNSVPFPPRQGVELPVAKFAEYLAQSNEVDMLVLDPGGQAKEDFKRRTKNAPGALGELRYVQVHRKNPPLAMLQELIGVNASFALGEPVDISAIDDILDKRYDYIWASPIGCLGFLRQMQTRGKPLAGKVVVGLNDATYSLYFNGLRTLVKRPDLAEWRRMFRALRTPWIIWHERRMLREAFAVHVQTPLERSRLERLFIGSNRKPRIICAQNGVPAKKRYEGPTPVREKAVLFMTHLSDGRRFESKWFLNKVWPLVLDDHPCARLWLVGSPPDDRAALIRTLPANVDILGYVADLDTILRKASVGIIPTLQSSGWVNRVVDYLLADLPIVACPEPLSTVAMVKPGIHAVSTGSPRVFAKKVSAILSNPESTTSMVKRGRFVAEALPTWQQTAQSIEFKLSKMNC